ncbi:MAG: HAD family phosphatase [Actinobacteria bacterium]|nr:HAD family phosphatase [Actinomycetota bacterium]
MEQVLKNKSLKTNLKKIKNLVKEIKVIYTDVDGTLLGPEGCFFLDSAKNYTLKPAAVLVEALKKDIDVVMISGRNATQLRENARLLGLKNYIAEMGTLLVYNQGEKIIKNLGTFEQTEETVYETIKKSGAIDLLFKTFAGKIEDHNPWSKERECTPLFRGFIDTDEANNVLRQNGFKNLVLIDNGAIYRKSNTIDVPKMPAYHLVPGGISKESGIKKDREIRNIPQGSTIAIGDAVADFKFAEEAGVFFLLKNGLTKNTHLSENILNSENIFVTENEMGLGWAEIVEALAL